MRCETERLTNNAEPRRKKSTRRRRICDLLAHVPTFLVRFLRLLSFVMFLLPAFVVFVWYYVIAGDRVAVYYGKKNKARDPIFSRHILDIYGSRSPSPSGDEKKPVVIFVTGGAWIIGYRMWGCLLGRALAPFGVIVVIPDYTNFPKANIEGMVEDVDRSIQWTFDNIHKYGGDQSRVVLVGQSAGAHIGGVVVALKALDHIRRDYRNLETTYTPQQLRGFISTSSPSNLVTMRPVFHNHGLSESVQRSIFGGTAVDNEVFEKWSPFHIIEKCQTKCEGNLGDFFPKICIVHGTADKTVPVSEAYAFEKLLKRLGVQHTSRIYEGWSHTDPILEAPMRGNHKYHRDVLDLVRQWTGEDRTKVFPTNFDENHPHLGPICPSLLVQAARKCNPF